MEAIIKIYKTVLRHDVFQLVDNYKGTLTMMPEHFTITKEVPKHIPADFYLIGEDFRKKEMKSGLRIFHCNEILYGDRLEKNGRKSLMIMNRYDVRAIELHFFYGCCPVGDERTTFLIRYLKERGLIDDSFPSYNTLERRYERKKYRRKNHDRFC